MLIVPGFYPAVPDVCGGYHQLVRGRETRGTGAGNDDGIGHVGRPAGAAPEHDKGAGAEGALEVAGVPLGDLLDEVRFAGRTNGNVRHAPRSRKASTSASR